MLVADAPEPTLDGSFADWTEVLADPANTSRDDNGSTVQCGVSTDRDCAVARSQYDLVRFAWTSDDTSLYFYGKRLSGGAVQDFVVYVDLGHDGLMQVTDVMLTLGSPLLSPPPASRPCRVQPTSLPRVIPGSWATRMKQAPFIAAAALLLQACATTTPPPPTKGASNAYFDNAGRDDVGTGGVKMIPIETPSGTFRVWTKRVGNNPTIKLLLLHGGPGATHEYFEACDTRLPGDGIEYYYHDQLGSGRSDQPDAPELWETSRFVEEVEQVRSPRQRSIRW